MHTDLRIEKFLKKKRKGIGDFRQIIKYVQNSRNEFDDRLIGSILNIDETEVAKNYIETSSSFRGLKRKFGDEQFYYSGTHYTLIKRVLKIIKPKSGDVVYDLGCGYGRFVLYGALATKASFKGIELIPERIKLLRKTVKKYRIPNLEIIEGDAKRIDYSDGNIFFIFNPFSRKTLKQVIMRLKEISKKRKIKIIAHGVCVRSFDRQKWLKRTANLDPWAQGLYGKPLSWLWLFRKVFWLHIYESL